MRCAFVMLVGCGRIAFSPVGTDADVPRTRLAQTYDVYEGGLRQPSSLYDRLLAESCDPSATASGIRCLPSGGYASYLDATCTQPVAQKPQPDSVYAFEAQYSPVTHAYTFAASLGTPAMAYHLNYDGSCAAGSPPTGEWFALTEIPFDPFVELTPVFGAEGRLVSQSLVAADGFRTPAPLHDTAFSADCDGVVYDDATVCFLYPTDIAEHYTDSTCTHVVLDAYVPVSFALELPSLMLCKTTGFNLRPLTTELPKATPIWLKIPGSGQCAQSGVGGGRRLFDLGAPIQLAPITRQPIGSTRIQRLEDSAGGAHANERIVYDSQLAVECAPGLAADGTQRCLPDPLSYAQAAGHFRDAGCTQPITLTGVSAPTCTSHPVRFVGEVTGDLTGPRIFRAGPKYPGPVYGGGPANCQPYQGTEFYPEGTELAPEMFSPVTQQTDP